MEASLSKLTNQEPIGLLKAWLKEAQEHPEVKQAEAMVLSTFGYYSRMRGYRYQPFAQISSRVVLLKELTKDSLVFYTNYKSRKGVHIHTMWLKRVALNFYWPALNKQIRIEGTICKTTREKSLEYWKTRPFESQISQFISQQSKPLENRQLLEDQWLLAKKQFAGKSVPCPQHWGGFAVQPDLIEFWCEKPHRLHDRLLFTKKRGFLFVSPDWTSTLLYP